MAAASSAWVAAALAALGLAGCLQAGSSAHAADGVPGLGDHWTMRVTHHEAGDAKPFVLVVTETVTAVVQRNGHEAFEVDVVTDYPPEFDRPDRKLTRSETRWLRTSDLALLEHVRSHEGVFLDEAGKPTGKTYSEVSTTVYDAPCAGPVPPAGASVGTTWTVRCTSRHSTLEWSSDGGDDWHNGTWTRTTTYRVEAQERVGVEAGSFDTYRVASASDPAEDTQRAGTSWVAPEACGGQSVKGTSQYENEEHGGGTAVEVVELRC